MFDLNLFLQLNIPLTSIKKGPFLLNLGNFASTGNENSKFYFKIL